MQKEDEKVLEKTYELNLDKFDDLLAFDEIKESKNNEDIKKENQEPLEEKKETNDIIKTNKEEGKTIDFSIFDKLLDDFIEKKESVNEERNINKISIDLSSSDLEFIKTKIRYYEERIENNYSLQNIEKDEQNILELNNHLSSVKEMYYQIEQVFKTKEFNSKEELLSLINNCKKEIITMEDILNIDYKLSNIEVRLINNAINKQERLINKLKIKISHIDDEIKIKNSLIVLKKMIYNSFKMLTGIYFMYANDNSFIRVMTGSLFILNSIIGMRKAINEKLNDIKYYKYKDYSKDNNIKNICDILNLANDNIILLQKELKENFSCYKEYFHDYEEVYFSICNIKKIIENSTNKLNSLFVNAS